jgi:hypothetical protein
MNMSGPQIGLGTIACDTDDQTAMIQKGFQILNQIISSPQFKARFLAFEFVQTNGMSNQQLWDLFEKSSPIVMNVDLHDMGWTYDHVYHTVGLDDASDPDTIYLNSYIVDTSFTVGDCSLHETWHKLGLSHEAPTDSTSVPYGANQLYEDTANDLGIDSSI